MNNTSIFPSATSWTTPRTNDIKLTTDNCKLILNDKLEKLNKVVVRLNEEARSPTGLNNCIFTIEFNYDGNAVKGDGELFDLFYDSARTQSIFDNGFDLTPYLVEFNEYATLETAPYTATYPSYFQEQYTNNTCYWTRGKNEIVLVNEAFNGWFEVFKNYVFETAFWSALVATIKKGVWFNWNVSGEITPVYIDSSNFVSFAVQIGFTDIRALLFRVYYTALGESLKISTPKTFQPQQQFSMPYSQQQPTVDSVAQGRQALALTNRTGVKKIEVVRTIPTLDKLRPLGSIVYQKDSNGNQLSSFWRLTALDLIFVAKNLRVKETWSENWSYQSEYTGINREFRAWEMEQNRIVDRSMLRQEYAVISDRDLNLPSFALILSNARKFFLQSLSTEATTVNSECNLMWIYKSYGTTSEGVALSAQAFGYGNTLVVAGKTKDNLSAGVQRATDDNQYCQDVYYANDDGTLETATIVIGSAMQNSESVNGADLYPYSEKTFSGVDTIYTNYIDVSNGIALITDGFNIQKSSAERLGFVYNLHLLSATPSVIIGTAWLASCPLCKERNGITVTRKVWGLTKRLPSGTQTMTTFYGTQLVSSQTQSDLNAYYTLNRVTNSITFNALADSQYIGMCITDEDNNVLVAHNVNATKTYTIYYTANRDAVAQALTPVQPYTVNIRKSKPLTAEEINARAERAKAIVAEVHRRNGY